jgi:hypothetical protein
MHRWQCVAAYRGPTVTTLQVIRAGQVMRNLQVNVPTQLGGQHGSLRQATEEVTGGAQR